MKKLKKFCENCLVRPMCGTPCQGLIEIYRVRMKILRTLNEYLPLSAAIISGLSYMAIIFYTDVVRILTLIAVASTLGFAFLCMFFQNILMKKIDHTTRILEQLESRFK